MARYKVLIKSFINDQLVEPGAEIEYDGEPGEALEPLDDAAKAAVAAAEERRATKAKVIAAGIEKTGNEELTALVSKAVDDIAALGRTVSTFDDRLKAVEAAAGTTIDTSGFAAKSDVDELDAGMQIISGRVDEVEGVLNALAKKVDAAPSPAPAEPAPTEPAPTA